MRFTRVGAVSMRMLKEIAYRCFVHTGLTWVAARLNRKKAVVLEYHGVYAGELDPVPNFDGLHVHVERFAQQLRYLAAHYDVVPLDELLESPVGSGRGKPLAAITLDDGYKNVHRDAYPVLRSLGLPATVFVVTDFLLHGRIFWWDRLRALVAATTRSTVRVHIPGAPQWLPLVTVQHRQATLRQLTRILRGMPSGPREDLISRLAADLAVEERETPSCAPMSVDELREMTAGGISVGSHGCSHDSFLHMGGEDLRRELIESKRVLELVTDRPITWLCYPYGDFSPTMADAVIRAGYRGAVTTLAGLNDGIPHPYAVRRIGVNDHITFPQFIVAGFGVRGLFQNLLQTPLPRSPLGIVGRITPRTPEG